jgi:hypothetical protein
MDSFSARLSAVSARRIIRWLLAALFAAFTFWGLINENDIPQPPSVRISERGNVFPRSKTPIERPGVIAGIVLGIFFGVVAVGATIIALILRSRRVRHALICYGSPRRAGSHFKAELEIRVPEAWAKLPVESSGPKFGSGRAPRDIWKPTELELDLVSTQIQNPALSLPPPVRKPLQDGYYEPSTDDAPYQGKGKGACPVSNEGVSVIIRGSHNF